MDGDGRLTRTVRFLGNGDREVRGHDGLLQEIVRRGAPMPAASGATTLVPGDPVRVAAVQRIFERYAVLGMGLGGVAAALNREGLPSPFAGMPGRRGGGTWSTGTIREVLRNPAYSGAMAWNRMTYAKFHGVKDGQATERAKIDGGTVRRNAEADWEIVPNSHPPLISQELFDAAQRLIKERGNPTVDQGARASRRNSNYLLSGLVRCARCGSKYQGYKTCKGRRKPGQKRIETFYYCCGGHVAHGNAKCGRALIGKDEFERLVVAAAREHLTTFTTGGGGDLLRQALVAETTDAAATTKREAELRRRAAEEERRLDGLVACLTAELAPVLGEKIVAAKRSVDALVAEADAVARERETAAAAEAVVTRALKDTDAMSVALAHATFHETREILRNIVTEVVINPADYAGEIVFRAAPLTVTAAVGLDEAALDARANAVIAARDATQADAPATAEVAAPTTAVPDAAAARGGASEQKEREDTTAKGEHVLSLVMAGAGFEPATSGL